MSYFSISVMGHGLFKLQPWVKKGEPSQTAAAALSLICKFGAECNIDVSPITSRAEGAAAESTKRPSHWSQKSLQHECFLDCFACYLLIENWQEYFVNDDV